MKASLRAGRRKHGLDEIKMEVVWRKMTTLLRTRGVIMYAYTLYWSITFLLIISVIALVELFSVCRLDCREFSTLFTYQYWTATYATSEVSPLQPNFPLREWLVGHVSSPVGFRMATSAYYQTGKFILQ